MSNPRAKHWCFTINNPELDMLDDVTGWTYMVVGYEVGEQGTPHFQGYVSFEQQLYRTQVSRMMSNAHLEIARGTPEENRAYCTKDGDFFESGTPSKSPSASGGKATKEKYKRVYQLAKTRSLDDIEEYAPDLLIKHYGTIKRIGMDNPVPVDDVPLLEHEWIWGVPGVGKSRLARQENPGFYLKSHNKWWMGYNGQDVVLIDDLDKEAAKWIGQFLKNWCDHYPFNAETKGDGMVIRPKKIVVTSNYKIEEIFYEENVVEALNRRFKVRNLVLPAGHQ